MIQPNTNLPPPHSFETSLVSSTGRPSPEPDQNGSETVNSSHILTSTISQLLQEREAQTRQLQQKDAEILQLKANLRNAEDKLSRISVLSDSSAVPSESTYKQRIHELQAKMDCDIKRRQQLQKDLKWSHNRLKEQVTQVQKLKHTIGAREGFIKQLVNENKKVKESTVQNTEAEQKVDTGHRDRKSNVKLEESSPLGSTNQNSEPIRFSYSRNKQRITLQRGTNTDREEGREHASPSRMFVSHFQVNQSAQIGDNRGDSFYRHSSQVDRKEKALRKLAEKCLLLQSHIEMLTHKLLGFMGDSINPSCQGLSPIQHSNWTPSRGSSPFRS